MGFNSAFKGLNSKLFRDELLSAHFGRIRTKKSHLYPLKRLDRPQSQFGSFKKEKFVLPSIVQPLTQSFNRLHYLGSGRMAVE